MLSQAEGEEKVAQLSNLHFSVILVYTLFDNEIKRTNMGNYDIRCFCKGRFQRNGNVLHLVLIHGGMGIDNCQNSFLQTLKIWSLHWVICQFYGNKNLRAYVPATVRSRPHPVIKWQLLGTETEVPAPCYFTNCFVQTGILPEKSTRILRPSLNTS